MINQGSPEWHRQRIGLFTSSKIADLMVKGKSSEFGDTAMSYIYRVAAERTLSDEFLSGAGFEMYIDRMDMTSKPAQTANWLVYIKQNSRFDG